VQEGVNDGDRRFTSRGKEEGPRAKATNVILYCSWGMAQLRRRVFQLRRLHRHTFGLEELETISILVRTLGILFIHTRKTFCEPNLWLVYVLVISVIF